MAKTKLLNLLVVCILCLTANTILAKAPDVKILVAQYNNSVEFMMPEGGTWQLGNSDSGEILPKVIYKIKGKIFSQAKRKYHLMVAILDLFDNQGLVDTTEKYQKMGFKTHLMSVGQAPKTLTMPDNRVIYLGVDCYENKEKAENRKAELATKGVSTWIYIENIKNSSGILEMTGNNQSFTGSLGGTEGYTLSGKNGIILSKVEHSKGYSWHGFENRMYLGRLKINFGFDDCLDCIEETDLEKMLVGVVPSEISSKAAQAAMEAQAVAARGEILSKKGLRHTNSGYDYCAEQHCQVYKGYQKIAPSIAQKIKDTLGKVLMRRDRQKILDAVYCSNCGGHTSANQNIWISEPNPHLQGISDAKKFKKLDLTKENNVKSYILNPPNSWCQTQGVEGHNKYRWSKSIDKSSWEKIETTANVGKIKNLEVLKRDVSGRITRLKIHGEYKKLVLINELEIRRLFGGLNSSCFVGEYVKDKNGYILSAEFKGAGFGHGVGMCQTGAQAMALAGYSYEYILEHYYPNSRLTPMY